GSHHHRLLGVAPFAAAASRLLRQGFLRSRAASPAPLAAARRICCQSVNSTDVLGASSTACSSFVHAQFLGKYLYIWHL
ncbi:unnamed protein product, partial [Urochloa humidicola]